MDCGTLSINRIAADDDAESILGTFQYSLRYGLQYQERCTQQGIEMLEARETELVCRQLYGHGMELSMAG
jgi:hypothetical protein